MSQDLLRQRRNLILISIVLIVFDFAKVSIGKVSMLGTELLIGNPQVLMYGAWTLWAYFVLRYYQYWRALPDKPIRNALQTRLHEYATKGPWEKVDQSGRGIQYAFRRIDRTRWGCIAISYSTRSGMMQETTVKEFSLWSVSVMAIKAFGYVCFQTHHATDYALPYALAVTAPLVSFFYRAI